MDQAGAIHLLDRFGVLSHPCDLDLLLFFAKHPHCLLRSETLAAFLGCDAKQLADSLDALLEAGLLTRAQTPAHAARLYVLASHPDRDAALGILLDAASTRGGRLALRRALAAGAGAAKVAASPSESRRLGPRRVAEADSDRDRSHTG